MTEITAEYVRKEVELYQEAVYFFAGFKKVLVGTGLKVFLEKDFKSNDNKFRPDFYCHSEKHTTVLDHKGSVTDHSLGTQKMCNGVRKYEALVEQGWGDVGIIVPIERANMIKGVVDLTGGGLLVMGFELSIDEEWLKVNRRGDKPKCNLISSVLDVQHEFDLDAFSLQKFIRHNPPVPLTASHLWLSLYQFAYKIKEGEEWFEVAYNKIIELLEAIYAPWIGNIPQMTRGRANAALKLLDWVGWIGFEKEDRPVKIFPNRSTRSGDILSKLIEKWVECRMNEIKTKDEATDDSVQTSIGDYTKLS
jgi:hypothetical protein